MYRNSGSKRMERRFLSRRKPFEVLRILVERGGHLVTHDELMDEVWKDSFVEDGNLRICIHTLRKILPQDGIETIPKKGYRLSLPVDNVLPGKKESNQPTPIGRSLRCFRLRRKINVRDPCETHVLFNRGDRIGRNRFHLTLLLEKQRTI